ncbi:MAG: hypothetical protein N2443_10810 [Blastocatellia bacterium]|nr:hypothetical protein [Blastocatellia bacterium]MCX7753338.1 hypothetical protein [Blastocatellia bacterium]MDW8168097.1 hypothetical protein [Acidobacteriota bacterium]MDW8257654.1 hypothetical protein [Acidobacteriota bacterium]
MSGTLPSPSSDPSKPILRPTRPEKHVQSQVIVLPPRVRLFTLNSNGGFVEDEREGLFLQLVAYHQPIERAPPALNERLAFGSEFISSRS